MTNLLSISKKRRACTARILASSLLLSILITGCRKQERGASCNCDILRDGLSAQDYSKVSQEIGNLAADLVPAPTAADQFGQEHNLYVLADRLHRQCGFRANVLHYNGIETYPPQSEIRVAEGSSFYRILDIGYDDQYKLVFRGMHE